MNGAAPKSSATGSQVRVRKKPHPNLCRGSAEFTHNVCTTMQVIRMTTAAKVRVKRWAIWSPSRIRRSSPCGVQAGPAGTTSGLTATAMLVDLADGLQLHLHDFFREAGVAERFSVCLSLSQHPLHELFEDGLFRGVAYCRWNQQPSEAGDRVSALAGRVGDGNAKILRHGLCRADCRGGGAGQVRLYKRAGQILHATVGLLRLHSVDQLDVADRVGGLLHQTGNALVALPSQTYRP